MNAVELTRELVQIDTINPHSPERPCAERVGNRADWFNPAAAKWMTDGRGDVTCEGCQVQGRH